MGPIAINSIVAKITANLRPILDAMVSKVPSPFVAAIMAKSGSPTPVHTNPIIPKYIGLLPYYLRMVEILNCQHRKTWQTEQSLLQ